ncbi:hypothetical protein MTR67_024212 [Solanum verrucosum]|uniref:CCHC-type domain-containing protein n=1 Tax=Solanum verrucosum TaxID=315347 RepID=A0AAF0QYE3_SOLVR|nr:hypothetical protein MTR67_024212 [Solanum verrucosum]
MKMKKLEERSIGTNWYRLDDDNSSQERFYGQSSSKVPSKINQERVSNPKSQRVSGSGPYVIRPTCARCGKSHDGKCLASMKGCYGCGGSDHKMRDCLILTARGRERKKIRSDALQARGEQECPPNVAPDVHDLDWLEILTLRGVVSLRSLVPVVGSYETLSDVGNVACELELLNENLSNLEVPIGILDRQVEGFRGLTSRYGSPRTNQRGLEEEPKADPKTAHLHDLRMGPTGRRSIHAPWNQVVGQGTNVELQTTTHKPAGRGVTPLTVRESWVVDDVCTSCQGFDHGKDMTISRAYVEKEEDYVEQVVPLQAPPQAPIVPIGEDVSNEKIRYDFQLLTQVRTEIP